ncbi:SDR family oxidoreductase [Streptomyces scabiei]|uniref:SDR family oxidoreductase n=1 Tax=Streptomyces scabiei TaxID=1930 RepID=UPI0029AB7C2B|nr:SDR family oxidoreductase [Streptomyces scabiei]MDX2569389.1 SDR family oxidoreductase [Streptomyces scabiei]
MSNGSTLEGRVAVVTGAARGVGELLARKLSVRGVKVALVGLEPDELKRVSERVYGDCAYWHADVTDHEAMTRVAAEVKERFGRVDIVVANAGVATGGPFVDSDPDSWRRVIEVNLVGSAVTGRAFLPALIESRGYLLQIASLAAITPAPMMTAYCASKSGVEAYAHCLRAEVAHRGVGVGVGYLSWTDTDMVRGADKEEGMRELRERLPWPAGKTYPLGPAVDRLVAGIERRSSHVYGQWWLRGMQGVRGYLPGLIGTFAPREVRRMEPRTSGPGGSRRRSPDSGASPYVTDRNASYVRPCLSGRGPIPSPTTGVNPHGHEGPVPGQG